MRTLLKLSWIEIKLFAREPVTMVFTFALPLIFLFVLGGVFGNIRGEEFRNAKPMDYYTPAYVGLVIASIGLVGLPVHFAKHRERGVLRRFRASPLPLWSIFGSQVLVSLIIAFLGGILLVVVSMIAFDVSFPKSPILVIAGFLPSVIAFATVGTLLEAWPKSPKSAENCALSYTVFEPETYQEWLSGCVSPEFDTWWLVVRYKSEAPHVQPGARKRRM